MAGIKKLAEVLGWTEHIDSAGYVWYDNAACEMMTNEFDRPHGAHPVLTGDGTVTVMEWLIREHDADIGSDIGPDGKFARFLIEAGFYGDDNPVVKGDSLPETTLAAAIAVLGESA